MPLGAEEDASVLKFLEQAEASGAKSLTDVAVVFAAEDNGQPLECRTHFLPVMAVEKRKKVVARVEGRVYGCQGTSNCQDKTL